MRTLLRLLIPVAAVAAVAVGVTAFGGCGSNITPPGPATVRGTVTLNGRPVAGGLVVFTPSVERGGTGKPAHAETAPDGAYTLTLDGANRIPAGWYRVSLAPPPALSAEPSRPAFPPKLARPDLSGIEREVLAGKDHVFEFAIEVKE